MDFYQIINAIFEEMQRQDKKFGAGRSFPSVDLTALELADPWGGAGTMMFHGVILEHAAKAVVESSRERLTWADILTEEVAEAYAAEDGPERTAELIQCAAVIFQWLKNKGTP